MLLLGLESFPQHELAKKQMTGFGGMVTFFIKGDLENAKKFFKSSEVTLNSSLNRMGSTFGNFSQVVSLISGKLQEDQGGPFSLCCKLCVRVTGLLFEKGSL